MRIAIDHSPLVSTHKLAHKIRGTGFYTKNLIQSLKKFHPEHEYVLFTQGEKTQGIDVFHFPYFEPFFISLPFIKLGKTVVTIHDLTPLVFPDLFPAGIKGKIKYKMQKLLLKPVDLIITDSESSKKDIGKILHIQEDKIRTIPLAASEEFKKINMTSQIIKKMTNKYNIPEKFALYVGDATPNKNLNRLIDASLKTNVPLVMVGSALANKVKDFKNPWNRDLVYVQSMAQTSKNIFILGFVESEDLVNLYNMAAVFVFPSLYEGFGLPVLEAASCGTPIITTHGGSIPEVIGKHAFFVDPLSVEDISEGLVKVYENKSLQDSLSKEGLEQSKNFTWKKTADETVKAYEEIFK